MKDEYDFTHATIGPTVARGKTRITILLDNDVLAHFRASVNHGGYYQSAINAALREWVEANRHGSALTDERPATVGAVRQLLAEALKR